MAERPGRIATPPVNIARLYWEMGFRVRVAREALGLTQQQLAVRSGLSRASVANAEAGRQRCPLHVIYQLAAALRCKPAHLLPAMGAVTEIR